MNQSSNQSIKQSINQAINQSSNQSIKQSINQSSNHWTGNQSISIWHIVYEEIASQSIIHLEIIPVLQHEVNTPHIHRNRPFS